MRSLHRGSRLQQRDMITPACPDFKPR